MTPYKSKELPVTKKMLDETRDELKSDIASLRLEMNSRFEDVDSKFEGLQSQMHRFHAIVEEQNNKIDYVLDGHQLLHDRQGRFENEFRKEMAEVKMLIRSIAK